MSDNGENWSRKQTLLLINELEKSPCLYNPLDDNFTSKVIKTEKLYLIANELRKIKPSTTIQGIKRKIRTLRSQLWKENQKILNFKKTGCSSDDEYKPTLWCFNELGFLLHCNDTEPSTSNIDLTEIGITEFEDPEILTNTIHKKKKSNKRSQLEDKCINALEFTKTFIEKHSTKQPLGREEEFCRYLCSLLKKIKIEENFDSLSLEILQLVNQKITEEKKQLTSEHHFRSIALTTKNQIPISYVHSCNLSKSQSYVNNLPPSPLKYSKEFQFSKSPRSEINSPFSIDSISSLENINRSTKSHPNTTKSYIRRISRTSSPLPPAQDHSNDTFQFLNSKSPYLNSPSLSPRNQEQSNDTFQYHKSPPPYTNSTSPIPFTNHNKTNPTQFYNNLSKPSTSLPSTISSFQYTKNLKIPKLLYLTPQPGTSSYNHNIKLNSSLPEHSIQIKNHISIQSPVSETLQQQPVLLKHRLVKENKQQLQSQQKDILQLAIDNVSEENIIEDYEIIL